jgi:predicted ATPase
LRALRTREKGTQNRPNQQTILLMEAAQRLPEFIVLSGGSGVGKTTLIKHLESLGYAVLPEAAMQAIGSLNDLLGPAAQLAWRTKHKAAFAELVGTLAMAQEDKAHQAGGLHFLDRSAMDNLGYARVRGYQPPDFLSAEVISEVAAAVPVLSGRHESQMR